MEEVQKPEKEGCHRFRSENGALKEYKEASADRLAEDNARGHQYWRRVEEREGERLT